MPYSAKPSSVSRNFMGRLLYIFWLLFSTSCYSYKVFPKEDRHFVYRREKKTAFVTNPELKEEYAILKQSGIFTLTTDSLDDKAVKVKLQPLSRGFVCGNPILASAFTLGQLPVYFSDTYTYRFQEVKAHDTVSRDGWKRGSQPRVW